MEKAIRDLSLIEMFVKDVCNKNITEKEWLELNAIKVLAEQIIKTIDNKQKEE